MRPTVSVEQDGRSGRVIYREGLQSITGYFEFGGGDVVAIVSMGDEVHWRTNYRWALPRRGEILLLVGGELIRQHAPSCQVDFDVASGDILILEPEPGSGSRAFSDRPAAPPRPASRPPDDTSWVRRYGELRGWLGLAVLIAAALAILAALW